MTPFACALLLLVACQPRQMVVPIDPSAPPEIGITATFPGQNSAVFEALEAAGAAPVFLHPPVEASAMSALADLDGLVLGGGADLDPALYGETAHASTNLEDGTRQAMDLALSRAAFEADVPLLGICLGAQVMVVQRGGSLVQDIPSELPMALDHHAPHSVAVEPGSPLARLYPGPTLEVRSLHHQAADVLPAGFELAP